MKARPASWAALPADTAARVGGVLAIGRRDRPRDRRAFDRRHLARQRQAEIGLALNDPARDLDAVLLQQAFRGHRLGDAKPLEHYRYINRRRATDRRVAHGDGAGGLQRALERLGRGDLRHWRALTDADRDEGPGHVRPRARREPAGRLQLVDHAPGKDQHVGGLAGIELGLERADGAEVELELVAGGLGEVPPSAPTARCIERAHITLSLAKRSSRLRSSSITAPRQRRAAANLPPWLRPKQAARRGLRA